MSEGVGAPPGRSTHHHHDREHDVITQQTIADPLVELLARAAEGDQAAQEQFLALRSARVLADEIFTRRARASAWRLVHILA